jgi:hypothetical protein
MNAENYAFSMRLVEDSIKAAQLQLQVYAATPKHDLNRIRDLLAARAWINCAKTNLGYAKAEVAAPATLKPLRARVAKGAHS